MTIDDLENAVSKLPPDQFAKFREWFEAFDAALEGRRPGERGRRER